MELINRDRRWTRSRPTQGSAIVGIQMATPEEEGRIPGMVN